MRLQLGFVGEWIIATVIGFFIGTFLGANKVGLVQHIPGDFLFGLSIGVAQLPVLYRHLPRRDNRILLWAAATAIAFPISVVLGRRSVSFFPNSSQMIDFYFGIGMGLGHGIIQALAIRFLLPSAGWRCLYWIPFAILGWIAAEVISMGINYTQALAIPTGLGLAVFTVIGWLLIFKPARVLPTFGNTAQNSYPSIDGSGG
jgi:hypothetical protein